MSFVGVSPLEKLKYYNCKTGYITKGMSYKETWYDAYEWLTIKENIWELPWTFDWSYNNNHISKQKPLKLTLGWVCKFFWRGQFVLLQGQFVFIWYYIGVSKARPPKLMCASAPVHEWHQGESFTNKRKRLQRWYQNTLTKPKHQIHPKELSIMRST